MREKCWIEKKQLNQTGGAGVKGGHIPKVERQGSTDASQKLRKTTNPPSVCWNEDARNRLGPKNIGKVLINGKLVTSLIDNSAHMNVLNPSFTKRKGLAVGSIADLNKHKGHIPVSTSGGYYTEPIGYVIFRVQYRES